MLACCVFTSGLGPGALELTAVSIPFRDSIPRCCVLVPGFFCEMRRGGACVQLMRRTCTGAALRLPVLRLPTTVFPEHCLSLSVVLEAPDARPRPGSLSVQLLDETLQGGGRVALLADGCDVGVTVDLIGHDAAGGALLHTVGGDRVKLLETQERTSAGGRMAVFESLVDEPMSTHERKQLAEEAASARALLDAAADSDRSDWELLLCTLGMSGRLNARPPRTCTLLIHLARFSLRWRRRGVGGGSGSRSTGTSALVALCKGARRPHRAVVLARFPTAVDDRTARPSARMRECTEAYARHRGCDAAAH